MGPATRTTTHLLEGLFDPAADSVWQEFDRRYRPIIVGLARKMGLADEDAADVAQETLVRFIKAYRAGQYHREKGRLRSWIIGIAIYRIADARRARAARRVPRPRPAWPSPTANCQPQIPAADSSSPTGPSNAYWCCSAYLSL